MLFLGGVSGANPKTGSFDSTDVSLQAEQALENINNELKQSGSSLAKIIKATIRLVDVNDSNQVDEVLQKYFPQERPVGTIIQVPLLAGKVEIEVIAME